MEQRNSDELLNLKVTAYHILANDDNLSKRASWRTESDQVISISNGQEQRPAAPIGKNVPPVAQQKERKTHIQPVGMTFTQLADTNEAIQVESQRFMT